MEKILNTIDNPADLRRLPRDLLPQLVQEIREFLIEKVAVTGGHIGASLGTVELVTALHYVFNTPRDKLIWDVGHQAYAHKIITGRRDVFHTLRQTGGISGFLRREESLYDTFNAGHSSTSISAALGILEARDHQGEDYRVVAVIGDGALTAGMAFEALNNAGHLKKDLLVVLNDNEMSISPNVGAISSYLNRLLTGQFPTRLRQDVEALIKSIPALGESVLHWARKAEEAVKGMLTPGLLFEEFGFHYVGPIDGHKLHSLIDTLENVKRLKRPVLLHVFTRKGKGFHFAEKDQATWHGLGPYDPNTGEVFKEQGPPSYTSVFSKTLCRLAEEDPKVVAITAAMPDGTGLSNFAKQFPNRFYDVGIAEPHGITFAAGMAVAGLRPVVAIYSTFLQRGYDQVIHDVCIMNLPVTFAIDRAGLVGADGPTHHGVFDLSYLRAIPNMTIMAPKDEDELQHMLKTAVEHPGPVAVRYPRGVGLGVPLTQALHTLPLGKGEVLRSGSDVALLALGSTVAAAQSAAALLAAQGIDAMVINARFVKPLDRELILQAATRTGVLVTIEEHALPGGFGSAVLELLEVEGVREVWMKRLGVPDTFIEHGSQEELRRKCGLDPESIALSAQKLVHLHREGISATSRETERL
ncbi:MAG TPA: 1-deoxy-D-xylulose-5-phosphate synthase [bacterium]|nr:1-deoxy-D-xylulose-5-phosphate synthase [bacterium]